MLHDVKLVKQDGSLWRTFIGDVAKRLPHIHHCKTNAFGFLLAKPVIELPHTVLRTVGAAKPDRAAPDHRRDYV